MNVNKKVHIPVIKEGEEKKQSELVVSERNTSGTYTKTKRERAIAFLNNILDDIGLEKQKLAEPMCLTPPMISGYLNGRRLICSDHLSALCIALRLAPKKQRYLYHLLRLEMPDDNGNDEDERETIIRRYMDFSSCYENMDVKHCNKELIANGYLPLTEKAMRGKRS